ncbi:hypothetical protein AB0E69_12045 [Kribbella sp. NPDC026611]|uniref:hypothetical protein n=1 Tax=Kribbella sp. NPDC026611 TaxID=3154911 RepID=UPI0033BFB8E2
MAKPKPDPIKQTLKKDKERLERDARWGRSQMDNDEAAQEVLDDEAAAGKASLQQWREDNEHHGRPDTGMGERLGTGRGQHGHRYGGAARGRTGLGR